MSSSSRKARRAARPPPTLHRTTAGDWQRPTPAARHCPARHRNPRQKAPPLRRSGCGTQPSGRRHGRPTGAAPDWRRPA